MEFNNLNLAKSADEEVNQSFVNEKNE